MKYYLVRIADSFGLLRQITVRAKTKQEAIDKVDCGSDEYITFCNEINE